MKVRASVKKICSKCKIIKRKGSSGLFARIPDINKNRDEFIRLKPEINLNFVRRRGVRYWPESQVLIYQKIKG